MSQAAPQSTPFGDIRRDTVALLPRLRLFALALAGNTAEADGLLQDAAEEAVRQSHLWTGEGQLKAFLFMVMRMMHHGEEAGRRRIADPDAGAVLGLPPDLATALLLVDGEGFAYAEAARILGISRDALAARLCLARLRLADQRGLGRE